jgi:hypothetical protein
MNTNRIAIVITVLFITIGAGCDHADKSNYGVGPLLSKLSVGNHLSDISHSSLNSLNDSLVDDNDSGTMSVLSSLYAQETSNQPDIEAYFQLQFGLALQNIYWGEFHAHTTYSLDGALCSSMTNPHGNPPALALQYGRDVQKLDFIALSDHSDQPNLAAVTLVHQRSLRGIWEDLIATTARYNNEDSKRGKLYITFAGYEYTNTHNLPGIMGSPAAYGHKNVIFKNLEPASLPLYRISATPIIPPYACTNNDLWNMLSDFRPDAPGGVGTAITIIHTPSFVGVDTDWNAVDADFTRNVQIYSKWGNDEGPAPQGFEPGDEALYNYTANQSAPLTIRNTLYRYWIQNGDTRYVVSFLGGTDNHVGRPATYEHPLCNMAYQGAVTGVVAVNLTRDNLWGAIWNRHTLACTTTPDAVRVPVLMAVKSGARDLLMGDLGTIGVDGQAVVTVLADPKVQSLDLIVDGLLYATIPGHIMNRTIMLDATIRHFVYVRANFFDAVGEKGMVWTSPVYLTGGNS